MKALSLWCLAVSVVVVEAGCVKSAASSACTPKSASSEEPNITAFASSKGISATKDASGLYYQIMSAGSGATPTSTSKVFVNYTGKFLTGQVFDQQTNSSQTGWVLGQLIQGWIIGLQLIQKGGDIKLIVPSSLAYGCQGSGPIPPNTVLYFDVQLVEVQ